jgi:hypothetical protein
LEIEKEHIHILRKLYMDNRIGGRHTSIDNLKKGVPSDFLIKKRFERAIKDIIKEGYIVIKPTNYGTQVSLNPNMIPRIESILDGEMS